MSANIITGYTGTRHITPSMDAAVFRGIIGEGSYIMNEGDKVEGSMPDINSFVVGGGIVSLQGRQIQIRQETLAVDTCATGYRRIDLIALRWEHDSASSVDSAALVVIKGTPVSSGNEPAVPDYSTGSIDEGASRVDLPLYRVDLEGGAVTFSLMATRIDMDLFNMMIPDGAGAHNSLYRGKYLGTEVTAEQYAHIEDGTFHDLFIGDYWTIGGFNWRIADFDYWLHAGDTECTTHHVVIVPDECLYTAQMNTSNVVTGAYIGSRMYTTNLASAKTTINSAFGSTHILNHREYLKNAATNGYESAGAWYDSTVELMSEEMVYGGIQFKNRIQGTNFAYQHTVENSQLSLFRLEHSRICNRASWWLRDVAGSTSFARVSDDGNSSGNNASASYGVRPAFAICA